MEAFNFDRAKYLTLFHSQGASVALTALHEDTVAWEKKVLSGPQGYQPALWQEIHQAREFSRELWDMAINPTTASETPSAPS